jgi:hypothetical protein
MLLAGIQAESGLDPRLKHSGVTILELHLFAPAAIFEEGHEVHEGRELNKGLKEFSIRNIRNLRVLLCG